MWKAIIGPGRVKSPALNQSLSYGGGTCKSIFRIRVCIPTVAYKSYPSDSLPTHLLHPRSCHTSPPTLPWIHKMCFWISIFASAVSQKCVPSRCLYDSVLHFIQVSIPILPLQSGLPWILYPKQCPLLISSLASHAWFFITCYLLTYCIFVCPASPKGVVIPQE